MLNQLRGSLALIFLPLVAAVLLGACSSIERTTTEVVPVDNGMGVPGVMFIKGFDKDDGKFYVLAPVEDKKLSTLDESEIEGSAIMPRKRALELLIKEAVLADLVNGRAGLLDAATDLSAKHEKRLKELADRK